MRPAHKTISAGRLDIRELACFKTRSALFVRASEHGPSTATVSPKPIPDSQLLCSPLEIGEEVFVYMSTKLYVGNLAFQTTSQELQQLFAGAGTVESASVVEDRMTGRSRGFAFVEMSTKEEAATAIDQFNGKEVGGRALKVNEAKPRENRSGGGASRGGFGGNRNGGSRDGNYGGNREPRW
jgi:cold-inducible RNA-binding protein